MSLLDMRRLDQARQLITAELNVITEIIRPLYDATPDLFPKPLAEMGASDKLKFTCDLLRLHDMMTRNLGEQDA